MGKLHIGDLTFDVVVRKDLSDEEIYVIQGEGRQKMIPKRDWVWYGFPGHFVGGRECAYHLCTRIGDRLVSTVGAYRPHGGEEGFVPLRIIEDSFYETMLFECDGETEHGDPNVTSWVDLYTECYSESIDAERGHRDLCEKVARGEI